jgi:hypothetical protein
MSKRNQTRSAILFLCLAAISPGSLRADPPGCPPSCYPPRHYRFPTLYKLTSCFHCSRPPAETYYSDVYSNIPASYRIVKFPCPSVDPAALYPYATPAPASSK